LDLMFQRLPRLPKETPYRPRWFVELGCWIVAGLALPCSGRLLYHQVTTKQTAEDAESRRQPVRWKSAWFIWATAMIRLCLEGDWGCGGWSRETALRWRAEAQLRADGR
jgi:hypothetical protein